MLVFRWKYLILIRKDALELITNSDNIWIQIREGVFELVPNSDNVSIFQKIPLAYTALVVF